MGREIAKPGNAIAGTAMAPRLGISTHENMHKHYFTALRMYAKKNHVYMGENQMYEKSSPDTLFTALVLNDIRLSPLSAEYAIHADTKILSTMRSR